MLSALEGNAEKLWDQSWNMTSVFFVQVAVPPTKKQIFEKSWD